ncbi:MAG: type II toxin-antitoxin system HicB family antitoxin [Chloroflexi bacterium]|nr:type II toxin-antitoxin system HicB family antitoxin [Chloroflexota bacterium]
MSKRPDKNKRYSMIIEWSDEDDAYIVTVPELPGCRTHGNSYEEAVQQAQYAVEGWIDAALADGQSIPPPSVFTYWSPFPEATEAAIQQGSSLKG